MKPCYVTQFASKTGAEQFRKVLLDYLQRKRWALPVPPVSEDVQGDNYPRRYYQVYCECNYTQLMDLWAFAEGYQIGTGWKL